MTFTLFLNINIIKNHYISRNLQKNNVWVTLIKAIENEHKLYYILIARCGTSLIPEKREDEKLW